MPAARRSTGEPAGAVVGVADRDRQRVRGVRPAQIGARQQAADHHLHLLLVRPAGADHGASSPPWRAYSATGMPASAGASSATPRA